MGQCLGPCSGLQPKEDYRRVIKDVLLFMQGRDRELLARLRQEMGEAADALDFERAAKLRDQIAAIERVVERQRIVSPGGEDQDVIGLDRRGDRAAIKVFFVRGGKLLGDEGFTVSCEREEADGVVLSAFLKQFYSSNSFIPCEILLGEEVPEGELIEEWLSQRRGRRVRLLKPVRGFKRRLAEMARENAAQAAERPGEEQAEGELLFQLKRALALEAIPLRIEAFDISSIQGQRAAGASVLFVKGEPAKEGYRRYIIKGVQEPDDYAMLEEVLTRRLTRLINEGAELPHLILIDGGRGQLGVALSVLERLGVADVEAAAIAKGREAEARQEHDVIYRPGKRGPIVLPPDSPAKHLLQRIRDEVHRFAITFHRSMRRREGLRSSLTEVPGLGPKRRRELLRRFGSLSAVLEADVQELASVPGMTEKVALALKRYFGEGEG
ncbi:MAG: excinuclease ABC subunit UvrC, partial [Nitrospinota bacterium]